MAEFEPAYRKLLASGELRRRAEQAREMLRDCVGCARGCRVNRLAGERGACRTGERAVVSSYFPHHGEEDCLRGWRGSGTIFFSWCNLRCRFCQNYEISQLGEGREVTEEELAAMMLELQEQGCHNINLVSPSHVVPQILGALAIAAEAGLNLPIVYNTGGYDSMEALRLLDGVIDIYMPDMKYADEAVARRLSGIPDYPQVNQAAVKEMHRQVGDLIIDEQELARRGLLVRHLILPGGLAGTAEIARFLAEEISPNTYINVMGQYRPAYRAHNHPPLDRPVTPEEVRRAEEEVRAAGLHRLDRRTRARWLIWMVE
ncbi:MAG TPA: radical SAM protein [Caldilineae bacterium]|nr:radical SAM protein [Caldilineae bacterium]